MSLCSKRAFTLIELLVSIAIIAVIISILLPALASAKRSGTRLVCLANLRSLQVAHWVYITDHDGHMLGTSHGGSWTDVLLSYDSSLLMRSPVDDSPHFDGGTPVGERFRQSSYAINYFLSPDNPSGFGKVDLIARPAGTAHFVLSAFDGIGAVADHVHPQLWWTPIATAQPGIIPGKAATEMEIGAHDSDPDNPTFNSLGNYGFLDGHAETRKFGAVYTDPMSNSFDPRVAQ